MKNRKVIHSHKKVQVLNNIIYKTSCGVRLFDELIGIEQSYFYPHNYTVITTINPSLVTCKKCLRTKEFRKVIS